jgi:hypothetical protein
MRLGFDSRGAGWPVYGTESGCGSHMEALGALLNGRTLSIGASAGFLLINLICLTQPAQQYQSTLSKSQ